MKRIIFLITFLASTTMIAQVPCSGGNAAGFPCDGFDLVFDISPGGMNASAANDSWGWTDPQDGTEYAIICLTNGTAFFNLADPFNPVYLGKLPTFTDPSTWRDAKVYDNHAFIVSEAGGHGMQVFDLTRLRNVNNPPVTFTEDAHYNGFGSAHNIAINEATGYAYVIGTSTFNGGPHFVDLSNPTNPVAAGGYSGDGYSHDAQIVNYTGPDSDYSGREIFIGSNEDNVVFVDVTDKGAPTPISSGFYTNTSYTHQAWLSEDQRYLFVGDEIDELNFGFNTRTIVMDVSDLDDPIQHHEYFGPTQAIDHNGYVKGDILYMANYNAGLRAIDISDIENQNMTEFGFFDTIPGTDDPGFGGSWSVYPFFSSGNVIISGDEGFFLVKHPLLGVAEEITVTDFSLSPNPANDKLTITSKEETINQVAIYNVLGQLVMNKQFANNFSETLDISILNSGMYLVKVNNSTTKRLVVN